jgi:K+-sensing histidine kinase KdpD
MSDFVASEPARIASRTERPQLRGSGRVPPAGQYAVALLLVAAAVLIAFVVTQLITVPNLSLIFVLPVMIAGVAFGWGPSLATAILGALAFDFFFTPPYFSFRIYSPSDVWAAALLLVIAAITTTVAAQSRRRAVEAADAAEKAEALQSLARVVIAARPRAEVLQAAAEALQRIFQAPAVIFLQEARGLRQAAAAGGPQLTAADEAAAAGALSDRMHVRAETYPYDQAEFEFWPVGAPADCGCVIGVDFTHAKAERPEKPERFVDVVSAYLAAALDADGARRGAVAR